MTEQELRQYLIKQYPKEDEGCEWKERSEERRVGKECR